MTKLAISAGQRQRLYIYHTTKVVTETVHDAVNRVLFDYEPDYELDRMHETLHDMY